MGNNRNKKRKNLTWRKYTGQHVGNFRKLKKNSDIANYISKASVLIEEVGLSKVMEFICYVKCRPDLYTNRTPKAELEPLWSEVAELITWTGDQLYSECRKRWHTLKLAHLYRTHWNSINSADKPWPLGEQLSFLGQEIQQTLQPQAHPEAGVGTSRGKKTDKLNLKNVKLEIIDDMIAVSEPGAQDEDQRDPLMGITLETMHSRENIKIEDTEIELEVVAPVTTSTDESKRNVSEHIRQIRNTSVYAQSYFDFFKSLELDFMDLTPERKIVFKEACSAILNQLLTS